MQKTITLIVFATILISLFLGVIAGYFYGNKVGVEAGIIIGRTELLNEQAKAEADKLADVQKAANPFTEAKDAANPFKGSYTNPFAQ